MINDTLGHNLDGGFSFSRLGCLQPLGWILEASNKLIARLSNPLPVFPEFKDNELLVLSVSEKSNMICFDLISKLAILIWFDLTRKKLRLILFDLIFRRLDLIWFDLKCQKNLDFRQLCSHWNTVPPRDIPPLKWEKLIPFYDCTRSYKLWH